MAVVAVVLTTQTMLAVMAGLVEVVEQEIRLLTVVLVTLQAQAHHREITVALLKAMQIQQQVVEVVAVGLVR
jgi:hypothetical protein